MKYLMILIVFIMTKVCFAQTNEVSIKASNIIWERFNYVVATEPDNDGSVWVPKWLLHRKGTNFCELGFRDDGVVIWRETNEYGVPINNKGEI